MAQKRLAAIERTRVELGGVGYVIVRETVFDELCRRAKVTAARGEPAGADLSAELGEDRATLAEKLTRRRQATGLSQAQLAPRGYSSRDPESY